MLNRLINLTKGSIRSLLVLLVPFLTLIQIGNPVISFLLLVMICFLPGMAILEVFNFKFYSLTTRFFYAVLFSLLFVMVVFTCYSVITHAIGVGKPISNFQVKIIGLIILIPAIAFLIRRLVNISQNSLKSFEWIVFLPRVIAILLPVISLVCVSRLNLSSDAKSTFIFLSVLIILFFLLTVNPSISPDANLQAWLVYGISAALVLGSTFRGEGGFWGSDINSEYFSASKVLSQGFWVPPQGSSAYDSMLSITVLPVVLSLFSNFSLVIIFKIFYALVLAYIPTVLYVACTRYVSRFTAMVVSGSTIIGSISFITQMTALARQVIGMAFFVGILLVINEKKWSLRRRKTVGLAMASGMAISHYSTAYLASSIFAVALFLNLIIFLISPKRSATSKKVFTPTFSISLILVTVVWNGVVTNSLQDVKPVIDRTLSQGFNLLPNQDQSFFTRWFSGTVSTNPTVSVASIRSADLELNKKLRIKPSQESLNYRLQLAEVPNHEPFFGRKVASTYSNILIISRTFFQIFGFFGLILLFRQFFVLNKRRLKLRRIPDSNQSFDFFGIGLASIFIGIIARTSGNIAPSYNPERAALQIAIVILIPTAVAIEYILFRRKFIQIFLAVPLLFFLGVLFFEATSLGGYINGSDITRISNGQDNYSPFLIYEAERSASSWLAKNIPTGSYLQTDSRGFLALLPNGLRINSNSLDPVNLAKGSYIYASNSNVVGKVARAKSLIVFPGDYIDLHYRTIYSSNRARIYH